SFPNIVHRSAEIGSSFSSGLENTAELRVTPSWNDKPSASLGNVMLTNNGCHSPTDDSLATTLTDVAETGCQLFFARNLSPSDTPVASWRESTLTHTVAK